MKFREIIGIFVRIILTYSMEQSPSWEANWSPASQEIPRILWNPKVRYRIHKCAAPVPILSQINPVHTPHIISHVPSCQSINTGPRLAVWRFRDMIRFYGEELLAPRPTPKLEDHTSSALGDCLFSIFAVTLHIRGRSSICNLRTGHAVVTETHLSRVVRIVWNRNVLLQKVVHTVTIKLEQFNDIWDYTV
jgi:hypothetical protein